MVFTILSAIERTEFQLDSAIINEVSSFGWIAEEWVAWIKKPRWPMMVLEKMEIGWNESEQHGEQNGVSFVAVSWIMPMQDGLFLPENTL